MHSIESLRVINDHKALKGSQQKFDAKTGQLINNKTEEISTDRTFITAAQARDFCKSHGATLVKIV